MKVWIVTEDGFEETNILGVFDTEQKAANFIVLGNWQDTWRISYNIAEFEVK